METTTIITYDGKGVSDSAIIPTSNIDDCADFFVEHKCLPPLSIRLQLIHFAKQGVKVRLK